MSKKSLLASATLGLALISAPAMAQDVNEAAPVEFQIADQFDYHIQPQLHMTDLAYNDYEDNYAYAEDTGYDWQADSSKYKKIGWGLFGGGLGLVVVGLVVFYVGAVSSAFSGDDLGAISCVIAGYLMAGIGGIAFWSGVGVLIYEAIHFSPYRRGQIAGNTFEWRPSIVATPDYQGFGLDFRF
ncbi:MAG: hypothetical protein IKY83_10170 [Proteobacteria bacterium]|nr:hypothetical protein [Pseudomonadota bacterium]